MAPETPRVLRARADECERQAADAKSPAVRATMLNVAARWLALAEESEARLMPREHKGPSAGG
jgi:hypothetical protein